MPHFKVRALYEYSSPHDDDLHFAEGQIITVTEEEDADWYVGEYVDDAGSKHEGLFPRNFVDKYEPEPPPRPNRAPRHKPLEQPAAPVEPPAPEPQHHDTAPVTQEQPDLPAPPGPQSPPVQIPEPAKPQPPPSQASAPTQAAKPKEAPQEPPAAAPKPVASEPAAAPAPAAQAKKPPPVAKKTDAFRDRLAIFNQGGAAPIQPFKSSGAPTNFIKKPFVAPPPSRNAYVPPPREAPQVKSYRRDEDPEIAERRAQDQENAERAGVTGQTVGTAQQNDGDEDQPKVLSLKERMALLQKQQQEQAERASALHKEKPKRPPVKKRTESHETRTEENEGASLEKVASGGEPKERGSIDDARPSRSSMGGKPADLPAHRELMSDANDADQSGAGETEDAEGTSTSVEDDDERSKHRVAPRAPAAPTREPDVGDEQDVEEEEEEEEDEMDAETRRKQELRERMARLGGGFNPMMPNPFGAPMPPLPPKKKASDKKSTGNSEQSVGSQPRVPMFPGMLPVRSPESEVKQFNVEKEDAESHPITDAHEPEEVPDVEDVTPRPIKRTSTAEQAPPVPSESKYLIPRKPVPSCCVHQTLGAFQLSSSETVSKTYVASDGLSEYVMTVSVCSMSMEYPQFAHVDIELLLTII